MERVGLRVLLIMDKTHLDLVLQQMVVAVIVTTKVVQVLMDSNIQTSLSLANK